MYLHLQDWSHALKFLESKGTPHGEKIIKVFITEKDPRELSGKSNLFVMKADTTRFDGMALDFGEGYKFSGDELEQKMDLMGLSETRKSMARAFIHFCLLPELNLIHDTVDVIKEGNKINFTNPLDVIDGIAKSKDIDVHLDIFLPLSISKLLVFVESKKENYILNGKTEGILLIQKVKVEGYADGVENN